LPSSGCKRLQKIFLFSGVFRLPFRPLAGETTTSTKGTTMNPLTQFKKTESYSFSSHRRWSPLNAFPELHLTLFPQGNRERMARSHN
jgi:hypothetical protein